MERKGEIFLSCTDAIRRIIEKDSTIFQIGNVIPMLVGIVGSVAVMALLGFLVKEGMIMNVET